VPPCRGLRGQGCGVRRARLRPPSVVRHCALALFSPSRPLLSVCRPYITNFFAFFVLFRKIFKTTFLLVWIQKIDPYLGSVIIDAEVTRLNANIDGAKISFPSMSWHLRYVLGGRHREHWRRPQFIYSYDWAATRWYGNFAMTLALFFNFLFYYLLLYCWSIFNGDSCCKLSRVIWREVRSRWGWQRLASCTKAAGKVYCTSQCKDVAQSDICSVTLKLVGCPCVTTAYNNIHINYLLKKIQDFLLIVSARCIIFFDLANWCYCLLHPICLVTTRLIKWAVRREFITTGWTNKDYKMT
jgi:hypothetical protein